VEVEKAGGKIVYGGEVLEGDGYESGCYVKPAIAEVENHWEIVQEETFAPLLYLIKYKVSRRLSLVKTFTKQNFSFRMPVPIVGLPM